MKNAQAALFLAGGYLLGRFHKMRWALGLAGVAAGKRLRSASGGAVADLLKGPTLDQLGYLRGELLAAGRTAAVAAASGRIDSLSDRLQERAASLRTGPGEQPAPEAEPEAERREREPRREEEPDRRPGRERPAGGGPRAAEREKEIARRRAERLHARPSSGARRTTQTSRRARRTAASERSGGRPGRAEGSATGEPPRRSRG